MNHSKLSSSQSPRGMAGPDWFYPVPPPKESCQGIKAASEKSGLHTFKLMMKMSQGERSLIKSEIDFRIHSSYQWIDSPFHCRTFIVLEKTVSHQFDFCGFLMQSRMLWDIFACTYVQAWVLSRPPEGILLVSCSLPYNNSHRLLLVKGQTAQLPKKSGSVPNMADSREISTGLPRSQNGLIPRAVSPHGCP